nr:murein biosynthesis integral membrane protein MurJ [Paenisporosarcina sp. TG20]
MKRKLAISSFLFILATLILKFSGLFRDIVLAYYFGDSDQAEAFWTAFILPNIFILLFSMGMKDSFIPSYYKYQKEEKGSFFFSQIFKGTLIVGITISILGIVLSPFILGTIYPEFSEEKHQLNVLVAIIFFSSIMFVSVNSLYEGYLDSVNKFSISVTSQVIVILSSILGGILFAEKIGVTSMAYGYLVGTILSLLFKRIFFIPKDVHAINEKLDLSTLKSFSLIFVPVAITVMVGQINLIVDNVFAGFFQGGAISYLNYAKNLVHFPQAIIGVTIGTIIFPMLSKAVVNKEESQFLKSIERGLLLTLFIILPAVAGMLWLIDDIIKLVFERGAFDRQATLSTATVAYYYVGSVIFFSLQNIINKAFYAKNKGSVILKISLFSIALNLVLNYAFIKIFNTYLGIPLASSIMALTYFILNLIVFHRTLGHLNYPLLMIESSKVLLNTLIMVFVLWLINPFIHSLTTILYLILSSIIGIVVYTIMSLITKTRIIHVLFNKGN